MSLTLKKLLLLSMLSSALVNNVDALQYLDELELRARFLRTAAQDMLIWTGEKALELICWKDKVPQPSNAALPPAQNNQPTIPELPSGSVPRELQELIVMLSDIEKCKHAGVVIPRGIIFTGNSGPEKKDTIKIIAKHARANFIGESASSFGGVYHGQGAKDIENFFNDVRDMIKRSKSPTIVFIDELDVIGKRGNDDHGETNKTIAALIKQLDACNIVEPPIIFIGATHDPSLVDSAITKSQRIEWTIRLISPDRKARLDALRYYLSRLPQERLSPEGEVEMVIERLAEEAQDFSYGDIKSTIEEANRDAFLHNGTILAKNMVDAIDTIKRKKQLLQQSIFNR